MSSFFLFRRLLSTYFSFYSFPFLSISTLFFTLNFYTENPLFRKSISTAWLMSSLLGAFLMFPTRRPILEYSVRCYHMFFLWSRCTRSLTVTNNCSLHAFLACPTLIVIIFSTFSLMRLHLPDISTRRVCAYVYRPFHSL